MKRRGRIWKRFFGRTVLSARIAQCNDQAKFSNINANPKAKTRAGLRWCSNCKSQFTVTIGTVFEDSKIPLRKWLIAWYMICSSKKGISSLQLQRNLELGSYRTALFMAHRVRTPRCATNRLLKSWTARWKPMSVSCASAGGAGGDGQTPAQSWQWFCQWCNAAARFAPKSCRRSTART